MSYKFEITKPKHYKKTWGSEEWLTNTSLYCGKILNINKGHNCSYHYHKLKDETFYVLSGKVEMTIEGKTFIMEVGDTIQIPVNIKHTFKAIEDSKIVEISTQHFESDSYRLTSSK